MLLLHSRSINFLIVFAFCFWLQVCCSGSLWRRLRIWLTWGNWRDCFDPTPSWHVLLDVIPRTLLITAWWPMPWSCRCGRLARAIFLSYFFYVYHLLHSSVCVCARAHVCLCVRVHATVRVILLLCLFNQLFCWVFGIFCLPFFIYCFYSSSRCHGRLTAIACCIYCFNFSLIDYIYLWPMLYTPYLTIRYYEGDLWLCGGWRVVLAIDRLQIQISTRA